MFPQRWQEGPRRALRTGHQRPAELPTRGRRASSPDASLSKCVRCLLIMTVLSIRDVIGHPATLSGLLKTGRLRRAPAFPCPRARFMVVGPTWRGVQLAEARCPHFSAATGAGPSGCCRVHRLSSRPCLPGGLAGPCSRLGAARGVHTVWRGSAFAAWRLLRQTHNTNVRKTSSRDGRRRERSAVGNSNERNTRGRSASLRVY